MLTQNNAQPTPVPNTLNQLTTTIVDDYINQKRVNFALMINGQWGCGKSWFVEDYIKNKGLY